MPPPTPHRTPLRRVSQGSLFRLSRSDQADPSAPYGLGFLDPALAELADEAEALYSNVEGLKQLGDSLEEFNESFASWLYVMNMNALTVDWPQAPTEASFELAKRRAEKDARAALSALQSPSPEKTTTETLGDTTIGDNTMAETTVQSGTKSATKIMKKKGKPKLTAKEKKERSILVDKAVSCLPLEFRGSDPGLRRNIDTIVEHLMDNEGRGVKILDLIRPDCNQARVNKCLIALVNRKIVLKENSTGTVLYHWQGIP